MELVIPLLFINQQIIGINFASSRAASQHGDDKFVKIENEIANDKNQMQTLLVCIAFKEDVPKHFTAMVVGLADPYVNDI